MANKMKTLQPGDKIYSLFEYKEVLIRGKAEQFLIKIEKVPNEDKDINEKTFCQHVRAMG
ncbi:hypothetical protein [Propionispora hippei]|uniref:Uncharacterized protein n=1 Tax=Propionispora hippei DSM 15287 TaxID=1123003 RepID=A0A1M6EKC3_9FIRM|nr:hypothetical protein [Propionispora hippei]SHI85937.1 hypothetical protein SAMN02745170_01221 [Propionispora hippei DSM 15287]